VRTYLLIDGNPLAWRSSEIFRGLQTQSGKRTGVVFGSLRNLEAAVSEYKPDSYYVVFDEGRCRWRREFFPDYKKVRDEKKKEKSDFDFVSFYKELDEFKHFLRSLGVKTVSSRGVEADDLIGLLTDLLLKTENSRVVIVGGDRDYWQLIDDRVTCYDPISKKEMSKESFIDRYDGLVPSQLTEIKALTGDSTDEIPGVGKIGEKTAVKLLLQYNSLENIFQEKNRQELDKNFRTRDLLDKKAIVDHAKVLVTILRFSNLYNITDKVQVLNNEEAEYIYKCLCSDVAFDRMGFGLAVDAYELRSIIDRLDEFVDKMTPKEDPLKGFASLFREKTSFTVTNVQKSNNESEFADLDKAILECKSCALRLECSQPVLAQGFDDCPVMICGRNPGATEDKVGIPFSGKAGHRLDRFLLDVSLDRSKDCWVTNCNKCYSTNNRAPIEGELRACMPFLRREIDLLNPKLILAFGTEAQWVLTGIKDRITKNSGRVFHNPVGLIGPVSCPVIVLVHPSFVIRNTIVGEPFYIEGAKVVREWLENNLLI